MKNIIIAFSLLIGFSAFSQDRKIEFRELTWAETLEAAKTEKKPIFIDCYTTWCGPCKWMSANIFTNNAIADYFNENYIAVKFDMEKGEGVELAKQFKIRAYPTLIHANAKEEVLFISVGASQDPQTYIANAKQALDPKNNLPYYLKNKDKLMKDPVKMAGYFKVMRSANLVKQEDIDAYFKQFPVSEWTTEANWEIIETNIRDGNNATFKTIVANNQLFVDALGSKANDFISNIYYYDLANQFYRAKTEEQKTAYAKKKNEILNSDFSEVEKVKYLINAFEAKRTEDWETYAALNAENALTYYNDNANELNSIAWTIFEHSENTEYLKAALAMAKRAVLLDNSHHILDTYANLLLVNGHPQQALDIENRAITLAKLEGADTKDYDALVEKIKEAL